MAALAVLAAVGILCPSLLPCDGRAAPGLPVLLGPASEWHAGRKLLEEALLD